MGKYRQLLKEQSKNKISYNESKKCMSLSDFDGGRDDTILRDHGRLREEEESKENDEKQQEHGDTEAVEET